MVVATTAKITTTIVLATTTKITTTVVVAKTTTITATLATATNDPIMAIDKTRKELVGQWERASPVCQHQPWGGRRGGGWSSSRWCLWEYRGQHFNINALPLIKTTVVLLWIHIGFKCRSGSSFLCTLNADPYPDPGRSPRSGCWSDFAVNECLTFTRKIYVV